MALNENLSFLRAWMRAPRQIGAVAPSGPALARLITSHIHPLTGPVIELGPGTGVFTHALLARGLPPRQLALVEREPAFAQALAQRFPQARVLRMDAATLGQTEPLFGPPRAAAAISGLPLRSMPAALVADIISGLFDRQLREDGVLYQFTYALRSPLPHRLLRQLDLEVERVGSAMLNVPPAVVYRFRRRRTDVVAA